MSTSTASRAPLTLWVSVLWALSDGSTCQQSHGFAHADSVRAVNTTLRRLSRWWYEPVVLAVLVHHCEEHELPEVEIGRYFEQVRADYLDSLSVNA